MRHKGVNRDETRQKMTDAVGRGFRRYGYAGVGVDQLAKSAGVTSGAFYSHFGSKNAAFITALEIGLDEVITALPVFQQQHGRHWLGAFVDYYFSSSHKQDMECGCAMASLTSEVVRGDDAAKDVYGAKMSRIVSLLCAGLAGDEQPAKEARAWAVLSLLMGGLNIMRALPQPLSPVTKQGLVQAVLVAAGAVLDNSAA